MNTQTREIHLLDENTPEPPPHFVKVSDFADPVCRPCKGTGILRILPGGRHIPCECLVTALKRMQEPSAPALRSKPRTQEEIAQYMQEREARRLTEYEPNPAVQEVAS